MEPVQKHIVRDILWVSRENNRNAGITGLLLYENLHFMQVLEGPETGVKEIFGKILSDKRHTEIVTIFEESISDRQFGEWAMAHLQFTPEDSSLKKSFLGMVGDYRDREEAYPDKEAAIEFVRSFEVLLKLRG